ncbi:putative phosphatidylglycerol/phosphatidylinositol transfer protein DDB_G0278295 [Mya arenaria]|uniref:putative phosphatidylglycerol/phosphatidylinositol transfer protein DDB_G0278295 n=1 Tax=Mya arenaria TaxID=6604 RepID=UPI0022E1525B|nr:putative phosphatidylglycerol/phosphatidylinositol transfer protein DDB_G0278295 [Mya arenaria]
MYRKVFKTMCNITCRKACMILVGLFFLLTFTSYMLFFNHGAPEEIMTANKGNKHPKFRHYAERDAKHMDELEKDIAAEEKKAIEYWDNFIQKNNFVSIGEIYDNCDEKDRMMVGRTILIPDVRWGGLKGVTSRTFINITLDEDLEGGRFYLEVKYNGNDLFARNWELCNLDEDYGDERQIYCPFASKDYSFVKDRQIPKYLPKGRYETKGWITDQNDQVAICGFADFTL